MKKKRNVYLILTIIFLFAGIFFLYIGLNNKEKVSIRYTGNNDIDYKVYLKKNKFFETPYLEKGKSYIASLIDKINATYTYNVAFSDEVSGTYTYYIKAKITADKDTGGNYWTKEYVLNEPLVKSLNNDKNIFIRETIDIDYNKFNDYLKEFKSTANVPIDARLEVSLVVESNLKNNNIEVPIKSNLSLDLPLSEDSIEATIDTNNTKIDKTISKEIKSTNIKYYLSFISGVFLLILTIIFITETIYLSIKIKKSNKYEYQKENILKAYDSIIVSTNNLPSFKDIKQIEVEKFSELMDAYTEIRMPINHYENDEKTKSAFFIIKDDIAWIYILGKKSDDEE